MDAPEPFLGAGTDVGCLETQYGFPTRRKIHLVALQVPILEAIVGAVYCERIALFTLGPGGRFRLLLGQAELLDQFSEPLHMALLGLLGQLKILGILRQRLLSPLALPIPRYWRAYRSSTDAPA